MIRVTGVKLINVEDDVSGKAEEAGSTSEYIIIKRNDNNVSITEGFLWPTLPESKKLLYSLPPRFA